MDYQHDFQVVNAYTGICHGYVYTSPSQMKGMKCTVTLIYPYAALCLVEETFIPCESMQKRIFASNLVQYVNFWLHLYILTSLYRGQCKGKG